MSPQLPLKYLFRVLSDFVIITIILALSINFAHITNYVTRRGFFCDDETLMYPFRKDTVTHAMLYAVGLGLPLVIIVICSLLEHFLLNSRPTKNVQRFLMMTIEMLLAFLYGFASERLFKQIVKTYAGRLRPYFMTLCQPAGWDGSTCASLRNSNAYMESYVCQSNIDKELQYVMRTSFPSAHASLMFYSMVFTVFYLQRFSNCLQRYRASFGFFVPTLQFVCLVLAAFVAISRVADYKHHWSDVFAGGLLGTSVAIAVAFYVRGQLRSVGRLLEAKPVPPRPPRPSAHGVYARGATMSVVSTQVSDISLSTGAAMMQVEDDDYAGSSSSWTLKDKRLKRADISKE